MKSLKRYSQVLNALQVVLQTYNHAEVIRNVSDGLIPKILGYKLVTNSYPACRFVKPNKPNSEQFAWIVTRLSAL